MGVLTTLALIVGIISGLAGVGFGLYELKGRREEQARAERAERAKEQMAEELVGARKELSAVRRAQERLLAHQDAEKLREASNAWMLSEGSRQAKENLENLRRRERG